MGKVKKGVTCGVAGCENIAERSISVEKIKGIIDDIGLKFSQSDARRVYLCEKHYKDVKKILKKKKLTEKWRLGLPF
ncbi:MAG: hypothetical protein ACTSXJ_07100 [Candidatus Baldrarchaeia archaeon]